MLPLILLSLVLALATNHHDKDVAAAEAAKRAASQPITTGAVTSYPVQAAPDPTVAAQFTRSH